MALALAQFLENAGSVNHARDFRRIHSRMLMGWDVRAAGGLATSGLSNGGVARSGDMAVSQRGAGANMSVDIAAGFAMVGGTESATQGEYGAFNDAVTNVVISASDPSNPRIDVIGVRIRDTEYSGANNDAVLIVVTGTPAGSPVVPTLPADFLSLAHVAVAAAAATIVTGNITDKRVRIVANGGTIPVAGFANLPSSNLWTGMKAYDITNDLEYVRNSAAVWVCVTPQQNLVATSETTVSVPYAALATPGPIVTIQTGTKVAVTLACGLSCAASTPTMYMSFAVSSATTLASADTRAVSAQNFTAGAGIDHRAMLVPYTAFTAGSNVLTAQYRTAAGTAAFVDRAMLVQALP